MILASIDGEHFLYDPVGQRYLCLTAGKDYGRIYTAEEMVNQQRGVIMNDRLAAAQARLRLAEEELIRLDSRPKEPIRDGETIITFEKRFGRKEGKAYTYAAVRIEANGKWYTTIKSNRTQWSYEALDWQDLLDFIEYQEDSMPEIWVATAYEQVL